MKRVRRAVSLFFAVLILCLYTISPVVSADDTGSVDLSSEVDRATQIWLAITTVGGCFGNNDIGSTNSGEIDDTHWFDAGNDVTVAAGYLTSGGTISKSYQDANIKCEENRGSLNTLLTKTLGFANVRDALCRTWVIYNRIEGHDRQGSDAESYCDNVQGGDSIDFENHDNHMVAQYRAWLEAAKNQLNSLPYNYSAYFNFTDSNGDIVPSAPVRYWIGKASLVTYCSGGSDGTAAIPESKQTSGSSVVSATSVDTSTGELKAIMASLSGKTSGSWFDAAWSGDDTKGIQDQWSAMAIRSDQDHLRVKKKCEELAAYTNTYGKDFQTFVITSLNTAVANNLKAHYDKNLVTKYCKGKAASCVADTETQIGSAIDTCAASPAFNKGMPFADRQKGISDCAAKALPKELKKVFASVPGLETVAPLPEVDPQGDKTTCAIDGVGWIVCPVMTFMGGIADKAYGFIADNFLKVDGDFFQSKSGLYDAWSGFRNIANVLFVIAFLVIIYSQITGAGISNYGIKKMLPKVIIAAVLVNISYFICEIMVDVSNILGYSLKGFFDTLPAGSGVSNDPTTAQKIGSGLTWVVVIGAVIAAAIGVALALSVPVLLATLLALAMIVLILLARKALIVLLIVISPVAFVAYLLPNTEQYFNKWLKLFWSLLVLFPVIAVVFGASHLAANIISQVSTSGDESKNLLQVTALGVSAIPFFVVPSLLKGSLSATGALGAKLNGWSNKANSRVGSKVKTQSRLGEATNAFQRRRELNRADRRVNSPFHRAIDRSKLGRAIGGDRAAAAAAAQVSKSENEAVDNAAILMQKQNGWTAANTIPNAQQELAAAIAAGDTTRARAAQKILLGSGSRGIAAVSETLDRSVNSSNVNSEAVQYLKSDITSAGLKSKDAALDSWSRDTSGASVTDIASRPATLNGLTDAELAGQSTQRIAEGGVSAERAADIQKNDAVWANMSEDKKELIRRAARSETLEDSTTLNVAHQQAIDEEARRNNPPGP